MKTHIEPKLKKSNIKEIKPLYQEIFNEVLSDEQIRKVRKKGELTYHIFTCNEDETAGFAITQKRKDAICHLWLCGLKAKWRGHNLGHILMEKIEYFAANEYEAHDITMSTHNERREMLALAIKLGYRITELGKTSYGDGVKIRLKKKLNSGREIRFLLTDKCNLKCFFCHSEGSKEQKTGAADQKEFPQFIYEAAKAGFDDITLTGGEPFLCKKTIANTINILSELENPPLLTIVSNGLHIDKEICRILGTYKNKSDKMKVHISLHSTDEQIYRKITGYNGSESAVKKVFQAIELLKENNIKVKLNCVLLNNLNSSPETLQKYLEQAHKIEVHTVKFLELMVIAQNHELFKHFIDYKTCLELLKNIGGREKLKKKRGSELQFDKFPGMKVEVIKLTCKFGCGNCLKIRDRTFNPKGHLIPCFVEGEPIPNPGKPDYKSNINEMISQGDEVIKGMAERYSGKNSPILTRQIEYVNQRKFLCFESPESEKDCRKFLIENSAIFHTKNSFTADYFLPKENSGEWSECQKTIWLRTTHILSKSQLILTCNQYEKKNGFLLTTQNFLDNKPLELSSFNEMEKMLQTMDFKHWFRIELEISLFNHEKHGKISLSQIGKKTSIQINTNEDHSPGKLLNFLAPIKAKSIEIPLPKWIYKNSSKTESTE
jgi:molybdenum cofactor biosynthesis enzyme MoaA/ribosomal protein S18 acetylase RimI-like enzyme